MRRLRLHSVHTLFRAVLVAGLPAVLAAPRPTSATIGGYVPIVDLANQADAVVVASVNGTSSDRQPEVVTLSVERTLKGSPGPTVELQWQYLSTPPNHVVGFRLWFLVRDDQGRWQPLPVGWRTSSSPARFPQRLPAEPLPVEYQYASSEPLVDKLAKELRAAAESSDEAISSEAYSVLFDLLAPMSEGTYAHVLSMGASHEAGCFILQLLKTWDVFVADRVESLLKAAPDRRIPYGLSRPLCSVDDPDAVASLGRMLSSGVGGREVQSCVARALHNIHTKETLPYLVALLHSPDRHIRYLGVAGLGFYAEGCIPERSWRSNCVPRPYTTDDVYRKYPSYSLFEADEEPYISFWEAWVANRQPNHAPSVRIFGPATCTPGQYAACAVRLFASASDPDDDPLSYAWSGCASGTSAMASCFVPAGSIRATATVVVSDGRGASGSASCVVHPSPAGRRLSPPPSPSPPPMSSPSPGLGGVNRPPVADPGPFEYHGSAYKAVVFDGSGSTDPDGNLGRFTWNFGDGSALVHTPYAPHIYVNPGQYTVSLQVDDTDGLSHTRTTTAVIDAPNGIDALLHRGRERFVVSQGLRQFDNPSRLHAFAVMKILPPDSARYTEGCRMKVFDPTGHVVYVSPLSVIACGGVGSAESYTLLSSPAKGPWRVSVDYYFVRKASPHGEPFLVTTDRGGFTDVVDQ